MSRSISTPALERALSLLASPPSSPDTSRGFLDILGSAAPPPTGLGQHLMLSRAVPVIYERWWRPALGKAAKGPFGPGIGEEYRIARESLRLDGGETVLDVACGPGNVTRALADSVGPDGLVVGVDTSATMLDTAVRGPNPDQVAYVRADAVELPFRHAAFDAVCCYAALHLFAEPFRALDHVRRVLAPRGRIVLFTTHRTGGLLRPAESLLGSLTGMAMFEHDEITGALAARGFGDIRQRSAGLTQFVAASLRPE